MRFYALPRYFYSVNVTYNATMIQGDVIVFIDEVDSLATSREGAIHEATRKMLGIQNICRRITDNPD